MKIKNKGLVKNLEDRNKVNAEITVSQKILVDENKKHQKLQYKVQRLKDKASKILDKEFKKGKMLTEFDYFVSYELKGEDTVEVVVKNVWEDSFGNPEAMKEKMRADKKKGEGLWADKLMYIGHEK